MDGLFLEVLNMSVSASWLMLAVIVIRFFMGKAPKGLRYVLWALVGIRLLCPISIESTLSMIPSSETFSEESMYSDKPEIHSGVTAVDKVINPILSAQVSGETITEDSDVILDNQDMQDVTNDAIGNANFAGNSNSSESKESIIEKVTHISAWVWLAGIAVMLIYSLVCYVRLNATLKASLQKEDNLWVCDEIQTPFILGLVRPRIYMPSFVEEEQIPYIVAHEKEHLKYRDHWWKPLGFAILSLHWFNPLAWISYVLLCRDIELACDERVIQSMDDMEKKNYSKSLLLCSNVRHIISACPVAFGEIGVKERIKSIVNYKKPAVWVAGIGILVCIIIAICFMTNPVDVINHIENAAKIELRSGMTGNTVVITDVEDIERITENVNAMKFVRNGSTIGTGGWSYWLIWYDTEGNEIESIILNGEDCIRGDFFFYKSTNGKFETDFYDELLGENQNGLEQEPESDSVENTEDAEHFLSQEQLIWFETEFFNDEENAITNMFLVSEYMTPADIDLSHLFYGGANGKGNATISQTEIQLLEQRYNVTTELDETKITVQEMNNILQKYTGLSLDQTNKVNLSSLYYLEEYDAYYNIAGDTMLSRYDFGTGWINEDGTITLQYHDALGSLGPTCQVTLREENGNYFLVSNVVVRDYLMIDAGVSEDALTLMQKVLLNKEVYNHGLLIGDVDGIYWSDSGENYLENVQFFNVDLDRDGVDEVCVEYPPGLVLIFHEENGEIYGYEMFFRAFNPVYMNGSFAGSSGAADTRLYGNVKFDEYSLSYDEIISNFSMMEYSGIPVDKYDFTVENILKYVNEPTSKVKVLETNSDIDGLEMKIEVFHRENDVPSKIEILFENNTSETLHFGKSKVYYQDGDKWKKVQSLEEISLLELWCLMSEEDAELANQATGANHSNSILHTAYPWRDYYMKRSGTYKIEFTFQNEERAEAGRAWIIIEQE